MVLTDREIITALQHKHITIEPYPEPEAFASTSVDLRLSSTIHIFSPADAGVPQIVDPSAVGFKVKDFISKHTKTQDIPGEGFDFPPGMFLLAWTVEQISLPHQSKLAARVEGKSSLARLGVGVHITAPTVHSGFSGPIMLEMCNHGKWAVKLRTNMRVCQLIFEQTAGTPNAGYKGQFLDQTPTGFKK